MAFYAYVFTQDSEMVLAFGARQGGEGKNEEMNTAYINDFDFSLLK